MDEIAAGKYEDADQQWAILASFQKEFNSKCELQSLWVDVAPKPSGAVTSEDQRTWS